MKFFESVFSFLKLESLEIKRQAKWLIWWTRRRRKSVQYLHEYCWIPIWVSKEGDLIRRVVRFNIYVALHRGGVCWTCYHCWTSSYMRLFTCMRSNVQKSLLVVSFEQT